MNREKVLATSRKEGVDEREQSLFMHSFGYGNIITAVLCFVFIVLNSIKGQEYFEFIAIPFATLSATHLSMYKNMREKKRYLILSIFSGMTAVLAFVGFLIIG